MNIEEIEVTPMTNKKIKCNYILNSVTKISQKQHQASPVYGE